MGTPVPFLTGGQSTASGAVPLKVTALAAMDPDGDAVAGHQLQVSRNGGSTWSDVALPSAAGHVRAAEASGHRRPGVPLPRHRQPRPGRGLDRSARPADWPLREEKSNAAYSKGGKWTRATPKAALGRSVRRTQKTGAAATFTFHGSQAAWIATMARNRGKAAVYVDGKKVGVVDLYAKSATSRRTVFLITGLTSGKHKVKVVVLGTKRGAAKGHYVDVDGWTTLA